MNQTGERIDGMRTQTKISRRRALELVVSGATFFPVLSRASGQSIHWAGYVPIGGIEQWIEIGGEDRDNPVVLWLSGGPGFSSVPDLPFYHPWEKPFTVVMWDERGEGKTFERSGASVAPTMTIRRFTEDGIEVAEYLCRRLNKKKIVLLGDSWGSILGIHMIKLRPDLFSAYVGTGQIVDLEQDAEAAYPLLLRRAKVLNNKVALRQLDAVGPPPYPDTPKKMVWISWANRLDPMPAGFRAVQKKYQQHLPAYIREGAQFSQGLMWDSIMHDDLRKLGFDFKVPIFFIQGAKDDVAVTAVARRYFDHIHAPEKKFVVLPRVGHLAITTARDVFLQQVVKWVRPVAIAAG